MVGPNQMQQPQSFVVKEELFKLPGADAYMVRGEGGVCLTSHLADNGSSSHILLDGVR